MVVTNHMHMSPPLLREYRVRTQTAMNEITITGQTNSEQLTLTLLAQEIIDDFLERIDRRLVGAANGFFYEVTTTIADPTYLPREAVYRRIPLQSTLRVGVKITELGYANASYEVAFFHGKDERACAVAHFTHLFSREDEEGAVVLGMDRAVEETLMLLLDRRDLVGVVEELDTIGATAQI